MTNLLKMQAFVHNHLLTMIHTTIPPFQLIHDTLGPNNPSPHSKAIMVECFWWDAGILCEALEHIFSPSSKFPFISFQVFYQLSEQAKLRYFLEHKNQTESEHVLEIPFPRTFVILTPLPLLVVNFQPLETLSLIILPPTTLEHLQLMLMMLLLQVT